MGESFLHRKTPSKTEKSLDGDPRPRGVEWAYRADKTELSIVWADSSTGKDWDRQRQIIIDRIAAFKECPLNFKNAGRSSDSLYLRYASYENEFLRFEAYYQRDGSVSPHIGVLGYLRFSIKDHLLGYPLHHKFIKHAESVLSTYGIPFILRYSELALDTLNRDEWLRLLNQVVVFGSAKDDYGHCTSKGKPKRPGRHPLNQDLYVFDKTNQIQVVFYQKEEGIYRVELRLSRKWLGRDHKNLYVGKINRFDTLFQRGLYVIGYYLRLYDIQQAGSGDFTSFERVFRLSETTKTSVNEILRRKHYATRLDLPPVFMETFASSIINVPQNVDQLNCKYNLQQLSAQEAQEKLQALTTRQERTKKAKERLNQWLASLSLNQESNLSYKITNRVEPSIEHQYRT